MESTHNAEHTPVVSHEAPREILTTPVAIVIAGFLISLSIFITGFVRTQPQQATDSAKPTAVIADIKKIKTETSPFIGDKNAPAFAYWTDYQCPFCKKFEMNVLPDLKATYVDTGKMKIVFKDFTFLGDDSKIAALFGRAVWDLYPDQYFTWREAMYKAQDEEGSGFGNRASIEKLTAGIEGIDVAKVSNAVDVNKDTYQKFIDTDYDEGKSVGVDGTPSTLIGKVLVSGLYPLTNYTDAINKTVKK